MKKVLCFGDSNTFGFIPENGGRYDKNTRWTGMLSSLGAENFKIIEAGCNNRTAFSDNPAGVQQTGYKVLPTILTDDLACVILAIGINDLQKAYCAETNDIKNGISNLIKIVKEKSPNAKILLIAPSKLTKDVLKGYFSLLFDEISIAKCQNLSEIYSGIAQEENCDFLDLNRFVEVSALDGLHYEPQQHKKAAEIIFSKLTQIL